jgi:NADPH-dependent curcumin reductase CurA
LNKIWYLRKRPNGLVSDEDVELVDEPIQELKKGEVRIRTSYISIDPTNRIWMSDIDGYFPPSPIDEPLRGGLIGTVDASNSDEYSVGDIVSPGMAQWALFNNVPAEQVNHLPVIDGVDPSTYLGPLGGTGLTAYFGLLDIGQPKEGETLVVSAAAGAVGSLVGQIGKIFGCRVVGIAGSDEKCEWLTGELGFDGAINYKTENVDQALSRLCPSGIDINFENVGGPIMDTVISHLNDFSRMPLCGLISSYNATDPVPGPYNFTNLLMRRTHMQGFIVIDYLERFPEAMAKLAEWVGSGKIKYKMNVVDGIEQIPTALNQLFDGANHGKQVVRIATKGVVR